ncbi:MAG: hypothetical protein Q9195_008644 [Heterodermia aff. obscurata]
MPPGKKVEKTATIRQTAARKLMIVLQGQSIIARLKVTSAAQSVCVETYADYPQMGRFTLRDKGNTIAIGKVTRLITDPSS